MADTFIVQESNIRVAGSLNTFFTEQVFSTLSEAISFYESTDVDESRIRYIVFNRDTETTYRLYQHCVSANDTTAASKTVDKIEFGVEDSSSSVEFSSWTSSSSSSTSQEMDSWSSSSTESSEQSFSSLSSSIEFSSYSSSSSSESPSSSSSIEFSSFTSSSSSAAAPEPVQFEDLLGVEVWDTYSNSIRRTLATKTPVPAWDALANGAQVAGDSRTITLQAHVSDASNLIRIHLSETNGEGVNSLAEATYGFVINNNAHNVIMEYGVVVFDGGTVPDDSIVKIVVTPYTHTKYYIDEGLVYTSTIIPNVFPLYTKVSLLKKDDVIQDVRISGDLIVEPSSSMEFSSFSHSSSSSTSSSSTVQRAISSSSSSQSGVSSSSSSTSSSQEFSSWSSSSSSSEVLFNATWVNLENVTVLNDNDIDKFTGSTTYDAGANSLERLVSGAGSVQWVCDDTGDEEYIGISHNKPDNDYDIDAVDYSLEQNGKKYTVYEFGTQVYTDANAISVNDIMKINISYDGTVSFLLNGVVQYTSTSLANLPVELNVGIAKVSRDITNIQLHGEWTT